MTKVVLCDKQLLMDIENSQFEQPEAEERPPAELAKAQLRVFYHPGPHPAPEAADADDLEPLAIELPADLEYIDSFVRQRVSLPPRNFERPLFILPPELHTFVASPLLPDPAALMAAAQAAAAQVSALEQDQIDDELQSEQDAVESISEMQLEQAQQDEANEEASGDAPSSADDELFDWLADNK